MDMILFFPLILLLTCTHSLSERLDNLQPELLLGADDTDNMGGRFGENSLHLKLLLFEVVDSL